MARLGGSLALPAFPRFPDRRPIEVEGAVHRRDAGATHFFGSLDPSIPSSSSLGVLDSRVARCQKLAGAAVHHAEGAGDRPRRSRVAPGSSIDSRASEVKIGVFVKGSAYRVEAGRSRRRGPGGGVHVETTERKGVPRPWSKIHLRKRSFPSPSDRCRRSSRQRGRSATCGPEATCFRGSRCRR